MHKLTVFDWELIAYEDALRQQEDLFRQILAWKKETNRTPQDFLVFCEHPHTFTLGKRGKVDDILLDDNQLDQESIRVFHINRGGEVTYHGPGQLVVYPILNLENYFKDVHRFVRFLEEVVIRMLKDFGIISQRLDGYTGVWVNNNGIHRKICALGVHLSRWVSMHGIALNVHSDLAYFQKIIPCGIIDDQKSVTSMAVELKNNIDLSAVKERFVFHFDKLFVAKEYDKNQMSQRISDTND